MESHQRARDTQLPGWEGVMGGVTSSQHVALRAAQPQLHLRVRNEVEGWVPRCWLRMLKKKYPKEARVGGGPSSEQKLAAPVGTRYLR